MGGPNSTNKKDDKCIKTFSVKPYGKRPLGRPWCRWEDNIKMDPMEILWEGVDCIHVDQDRDQWRALMNTVINLWVPQKAGNFLTS
jgi:hypothetical protein